MGLFSFSRKNKQEPASGDGEFYSRADEESTAVRGRGKRKGNQVNEPVDPVLPEKKRARRRLVGAIALVLAAIIGLPMIFDSEPKPVADDIAIQIPSKNKPINSIVGRPSVTLAPASLGPGEEIVGTSNSPSRLAGLTASPSDANKISETVKAGTLEKPNAKASAAPEAKPDINAEKNQAQKINANGAIKEELKPVSVVDQKAGHTAKLTDNAKEHVANSSDSKTATDKNSGKYAVQVAALVTQEKINELQSKLKKAGFTTFTQKVATESGFSTRIRVGPYATKGEADKAVAKLTKMGLKGTPVQSGH